MSESVPSTLISNLPAASSVSDTDIVVLENGSTTQKITIAQLKEALGINVLNTKINSYGLTYIGSAYTNAGGSTTTTSVDLNAYDAFIFSYKYGQVYTTSFFCMSDQLKTMTAVDNCINMEHSKKDDVACLIYSDGSKNIKIFHNTAYYPIEIRGLKL